MFSRFFVFLFVSKLANPERTISSGASQQLLVEDDWFTIDGVSFSFTNVTSSWLGGKQLCIIKGGRLAFHGIRDPSIYLKLKTYLSSGKSYWFSMNDLEKDSLWMWGDEEVFDPNHYDQLLFEDLGDLSQKTNDDDTDCAYISNDHQRSWNDDDCYFGRHFAVCEKDVYFATVDATETMHSVLSPDNIKMFSEKMRDINSKAEFDLSGSNSFGGGLPYTEPTPTMRSNVKDLLEKFPLNRKNEISTESPENGKLTTNAMTMNSWLYTNTAKSSFDISSVVNSEIQTNTSKFSENNFISDNSLPQSFDRVPVTLASTYFTTNTTKSGSKDFQSSLGLVTMNTTSIIIEDHVGEENFISTSSSLPSGSREATSLTSHYSGDGLVTGYSHTMLWNEDTFSTPISIVELNTTIENIMSSGSNNKVEETSTMPFMHTDLLPSTINISQNTTSIPYSKTTVTNANLTTQGNITSSENLLTEIFQFQDTSTVFFKDTSSINPEIMEMITLYSTAVGRDPPSTSDRNVETSTILPDTLLNDQLENTTYYNQKNATATSSNFSMLKNTTTHSVSTNGFFDEVDSSRNPTKISPLYSLFNSTGSTPAFTVGINTTPETPFTMTEPKDKVESITNSLTTVPFVKKSSTKLPLNQSTDTENAFVNESTSSKASACNPSPCKNGCTCKESCQHSRGYFCHRQGSLGYLGKNCTHEPPKVQCDKDAIDIKINSKLMTEYEEDVKNGFFYLSFYNRPQGFMVVSSKCIFNLSYASSHYNIKILPPFDQCGTKRFYQMEGYAFYNRVWWDRQTSNPILSFRKPIADVSCVYKQDYNLTSFASNKHEICCDTLPQTSISQGVFLLKSSLSKYATVMSRSFGHHKRLPTEESKSISPNGYVQYTVGQTIFFKVALEMGDIKNYSSSNVAPIDHLVPHFKSCWLSHDQNSSLSEHIILYPSTNDYFGVWGPKTLADETFIGFKILKWTSSEWKLVYLHCLVEIESFSRRKRSVGKDENLLNSVVKGPILIISNQSEIKRENLKSYGETNDQRRKSFAIVLILVVIGIVLLAAVICFTVYFNWLRDSRPPLGGGHEESIEQAYSILQTDPSILTA